MNDDLKLMIRRADEMRQRGQVAQAIEAYQAILRRAPHLSLCWFNLGVMQRKARQLPAALHSYQKALDLGISEPEEVHLNRSVIYNEYLRDDAAAERELQRALKLNPRYAPAMLNLANLYEDLGRLEPARALYERILDLDGRAFEALARYANLHPATAPNERVLGLLNQALLNPGASSAERASLGFALGRLRDGRGEYAAAFDAIAAANRASRESAAAHAVPYNRLQQEQWVDRLIRVSAASTNAPVAPPESGELEPIFICGMFRSGSTLTEQLVTAHAGVSAGGEMDFLARMAAFQLAPFPESMRSLGADKISELRAQYLANLAERFPQARRVTDKRPDNFQFIGLIKTLFPRARIVHSVRNPLDNCLSIYFLHLDHSMGYALNLMDIGHYYCQYRRLLTHWRARYPGDIFDFDYDRFVQQPSIRGAELFKFLGVEWQDRYLLPSGQSQSVRTASVWQVREPIYTRSSGRASHYARELEELGRYLAAHLPAE